MLFTSPNKLQSDFSRYLTPSSLKFNALPQGPIKHETRIVHLSITPYPSKPLHVLGQKSPLRVESIPTISSITQFTLPHCTELQKPVPGMAENYCETSMPRIRGEHGWAQTCSRSVCFNCDPHAFTLWSMCSPNSQRLTSDKQQQNKLGNDS